MFGLKYDVILEEFDICSILKKTLITDSLVCVIFNINHDKRKEKSIVVPKMIKKFDHFQEFPPWWQEMVLHPKPLLLLILGFYIPVFELLVYAPTVELWLKGSSSWESLDFLAKVTRSLPTRLAPSCQERLRPTAGSREQNRHQPER